MGFARVILLVIAVLAAGCGSRYEVTRSQSTFLRRMPQITRVDAGKPLPKGSFAASLSGGYALREPELLVVTDSSFEAYSHLLGDDVSIVTASQTYCYESRMSVSGDAMYGHTDYMAFGLSLDLSLGEIQSPSPQASETIHNEGFEGALFCRFAKQYGNVAVAVRPELVAATVYGDRITAEHTSPSGQILSATDKIATYILAVQSSSILRYEFADPLAAFAAFTLKLQPYPTTDQEIMNEIAYGFFGGVDLRWKLFSLTPWIAVPAGASITDYRSPVSAGMKVSFQLHDR
jgi:hypothetical protein